MARPTCIASPWSATISRLTPASAPAVRTARACLLESASRRCGWSASPWEERAREHRQPNIRDKIVELARAGGATRRDRRRCVHRQRRDRRTVLCAVRLDGADALDRRCAGGVEISVWLWRGVAADPDHAAGNRTTVRRNAEARRRRGVPLARRPFAGLGQARGGIAWRPYPDAAGPALHQRPCRFTEARRTRRGRGRPRRQRAGQPLYRDTAERRRACDLQDARQ